MVGKTISHYQVLEKIGEGGMGVVYKARDTRLSRLVALKVLPPGKIGDTECKRRFVQEAQAASALNHPNIVHIYDIDQQDGVEYIAMEYVAGKTLDQLIPRHGMRLNEALKHSVEIADALTKAHSAGIIHRDLKPSNVMVNAEGRVKVLDFGLAKLTEAAPLEEDEATLPAKPRTKEGTIVGTVSYMSPEQAEGKKVDARSDIFSFGSVLYEMVTGRHAFRGDTQVSTLAAIIHKEPESLGSEVPAELSRIITRCLRKDPERRFQLMKDLKIELAEFKEESDSGKLVAVEAPSRSRKRRFLWPAVAAAAAIVLTAAGFFVWQRMQDKPLTERDWIVLADFTNATGDPVFDVALKQALSASLNQSPYLNVLPDERVAGILTLMGRSPDERVTGRVAREVCERAGVKALLTGSINALGSHYSIGLDATNCRTGDRLAQEQLEAASKEQVLGMLGQAATRMRRRLGESLASIQKLDVPLVEATTSSLEALRAYSLGREQSRKGAFREAIPYYRRAVEIDPNFAVAYRSLSASYNNLGQRELSEQSSTRAFELRQRASERERLAIEARYYSAVLGDLDKTVEATRALAQVYPNESSAFTNWGNIFNDLGQSEKASDLFLQAVRVSGGAEAVPYINLAYTYIRLNRFAEARAVSEQVNAKFGATLGQVLLYLLAEVEGDVAAMERQAQWFQGKPEEYQGLGLQANTAAVAGQFQKSRTLGKRAMEMAVASNLREVEAFYLSQEAVQEAQVGYLLAAREAATRSLNLTRDRSTVPLAAVALALAGSTGAAQALMEEFTRRYPQDTLLKSVSVPSVRAISEVSQGNPHRAIELLENASAYELGACPGCTSILPLRGQAYMRAGAAKEAAAAFQKVLDHRGIFTGIEYPLAHLGLARASVLAGDTSRARKAYQDFLALWKDADSDIPILKQAKQEYVKLK